MNYWNETPLFRFLLLFIGGILVAVYYPCLSIGVALLFCFLTIFLFFLLYLIRKRMDKYRRRWIAGILIYAAMLLSGYALTFLNTEKTFINHFRNAEGANEFIACLDEPLNVRAKSLKTVMRVLFIKDKGAWKNASGYCLTYFGKDSASSVLKYGDMVLFSTKPMEVPPPANPSQFDYKRWLAYNKIFDQVYLSSGKWKLLDRNCGNPLAAFSFELRNELLRVFSTHYITGQDYAVLAALILGYEDDIDQEIISAYAASGALHVLSVSGLHVGIIYIAIDFFLGFLNRNRKTRLMKSIIIITFLWFYALLTGLSPSVLRSATMLSFIVIGKMTRQHTHLYNTLAASAFFLLALNPFLLMQVGFQLSYLAVLGIIFLQPAIQAWTDPPGWLLKQIWGVTAVSIAAQVATFPLGLFYFHQFPVYFLISNLIVIPISTVIIYGGIFILLISGWQLGASVAGILLGDVVHLMNAIVESIERLPFALVTGISISVLETWLLYICVGACLNYFRMKTGKHLILFLVVVILILGSQIAESLQLSMQRQLVVFSIKGKSFVNIIDGKNNFVSADTSVVSNRSLMLFNVNHYWWDRGIDENGFSEIHSGKNYDDRISCYRNIIQFGEVRIANVKDSLMLNRNAGKTQVDFVILSCSVRTTIKKLSEHFQFKHLIIDSSNSLGQSNRLLEEARSEGISAWSVPQQGAFVYDLSRN